MPAVTTSPTASHASGRSAPKLDRTTICIPVPVRDRLNALARVHRTTAPLLLDAMLSFMDRQEIDWQAAVLRGEPIVLGSKT